MTDHFAVLEQPRRPWLEPEQLKEQYQRLAAEHHPDRKSQGDRVPSPFTAVNEAYRVLSNPRLRLHHLIDLETQGVARTETSEVAAELAEIFMEAAHVVSLTDAHLRKLEQATSALTKSLRQTEAINLRKNVDLLLERLQQSYAKAERDLQRADETWSKDLSIPVDELQELARRFTFLERWIGQLRERQFQLST
jgi:curved DNA-binding protein CbpA